MARYKTRQMEELLNYMSGVKGSHVTVNDISEHFKNNDIKVGMTTIYRNLEKLVEDGYVAKYIIDGTSSACFEYIDDKSFETNETCYHCKCEQCGRIIHLHCNEVENLRQHMIKQHDFKLNSKRTVFYGLCSECSKG